jgi:hypothetical protein
MPVKRRWGYFVLLAAVVVTTLPADATVAESTIFLGKVGPEEEAIEGAGFTLYNNFPPLEGPRGPEDTSTGMTCTTDEQGGCGFTGLPAGSYWVVETRVPNGYSPSEDVPITLEEGEGVSLTVRDEVAPPNQIVNTITSDTTAGDGTHISQFGPSIAVSLGQTPNVFVAFNDTTGLSDSNNPSGTGFSYSMDGGQTFTDIGPLPTGGPNNAIFGQPSLGLRESDDNLFVANNFCLRMGNDVRCPIGISRSTDGGRTWTTPVPTWPTIDPFPALAHSGAFAVDNSAVSPFMDRLFVAFTQSNAAHQSSIMFTSSNDSGQTWSAPQALTEPDLVDHPDVTTGPDGRVYVTYADFDTTSYDVVLRTSDDAGQTWSPPNVLFNDVLRSGDEANCGTEQAPNMRRVYNGFIAASDTPRVAVDPVSGRFFVTWTQHGEGDDQSDVFYAYSNDGGQTWSPRLPTGAREDAQFYPSIGVSVDGTLGIAFYDRRSGNPNTDVTLNFFDSIGLSPTVKSVRVTERDFPIWQLNPNYDTELSNCFGLDPLDMAFPGSGAFVAWTDGRDPGPTANNGVDPNIYFARVPEPPAITTTTLSIDKTRSKIAASGDVTPSDPDGEVIVTLFRKKGGTFKRMASKTALLNAEGRFVTLFARPDDGRCRVRARYPGDEEHLPSAKTKTFAC